MATQAEILALIQQFDLSRLAPKLTPLIQPSIRVRTRLSGDDMLPTGSSKFGGSPDLPPGFAWPEWTIPRLAWWEKPLREAGIDAASLPERLSGPLSFIGQFNLAEVAPYDIQKALPATGLLYFFCAPWKDALGYDEPDEAQLWKVHYFDGDPASTVRTAMPMVPPELERVGNAMLYDFDTRLAARNAEFMLEHVVPSGDAEELGAIPFEEREGYGQLLEALESADGVAGVVHRLLGHAQFVQSEMRGDFLNEAQIEEPVPPGHLTPDYSSAFERYSQARDAYNQARNETARRQNWRLLLQLDSEEGEDYGGFYWQLGGRVYWWIQEADLQRRNFDRVWVMHQSS